MQHWGHGPIIVCSHDDIMEGQICPLQLFLWEKVKTTDFSGAIIDFYYETCINLSPVHQSKFSFSKATGSVKAKLHMDPWIRGMKVCLRGLGHITMMAAHPYMIKTLSNFSFKEPMGKWPWDLVCSIGNMDPS